MQDLKKSRFVPCCKRLALLLCLVFAGMISAAALARTATVVVLQLNAPIGPALQTYVQQGLAQAERQHAAAVVLQVDTPGGLGTSMRGIIQAMLRSPVPVFTYVAPSGARAASAGTFIVYASAFAGMAPGTHLGAATPVSITGGGAKQPKPAEQAKNSPATKKTSPAVGQATAMRQKVTNDSVAFIRGLAQLHGRNPDFAVRAVTEAATMTASEAVKAKVVNVEAKNLATLLQAARGKMLLVNGQRQKFNLGVYSLKHIEPSWQIKLLSIITSPSMAYFLLIAGAYGLFFEFSNPGFVAPGVVGAICLLLGFYALQLLPINYAGLALLGLGVGFMIAEALMPGVGVLGLGGVIAFFIGSMMLIDTGHPAFQIARGLIIILSLLSAAFFIVVGRLAMRSRRQPVVSGTSPLIGMQATVTVGAGDRFYVFLQSERWQVTCTDKLRGGERVEVVSTQGVILAVKIID